MSRLHGLRAIALGALLVGATWLPSPHRRTTDTHHAMGLGRKVIPPQPLLLAGPVGAE
jgi:hypothetical protein